MKILHTADIHLGSKDYGKIDPKTGRNTRLEDFRRCFDFMVNRGIDEDIDVFLFCGDAYRTATPTPTQQKVFADCLAPVARAGIPILMITGNHDHPVSFGKASSIDIFKHLRGKVTVFRQPQSVLIETKSGPLQLLAMPWPVSSLLLLGDRAVKASPEEVRQEIEKYYVNFISEKTTALDRALPTVLAGHFTVTGSTLGGSERTSLLIREPTFSPAQLSVPPVDYVALGHIHHFQNLATDADAPPVVYSSSIERVTFNEENSAKGFVLVTIGGNPKKTSFRFIETPARRFLSVHVDAAEHADPTEAILREIARHNVTDSIVRVRFQITESQRPHVDMRRIRAALKTAFAIASIERVAVPVTRHRRSSVTNESKLEDALRSYIDQHDHLIPMRDALVRKANELESRIEHTRRHGDQP